MEAKAKQEIIDTMLNAAGALDEAEATLRQAQQNETVAGNTRTERARAYNTALEAYLKVFPKVQV